MKADSETLAEWDKDLDELLYTKHSLTKMEAIPNHPVLQTAMQSYATTRMRFTKKWGPGGDRAKEVFANPLDRKRKCTHCGKMTRITTAGCDHCDIEDK